MVNTSCNIATCAWIGRCLYVLPSNINNLFIYCLTLESQKWKYEDMTRTDSNETQTHTTEKNRCFEKEGSTCPSNGFHVMDMTNK